jgi:hypothetical protein
MNKKSVGMQPTQHLRVKFIPSNVYINKNGKMIKGKHNKGIGL